MITNLKVFGLTQLGIKAESIASKADALTTRPSESENVTCKGIERSSFNDYLIAAEYAKFLYFFLVLPFSFFLCSFTFHPFSLRSIFFRFNDIIQFFLTQKVLKYGIVVGFIVFSNIMNKSKIKMPKKIKRNRHYAFTVLRRSV